MSSSIATRTGDSGTTGLVFGQRVPKDHPRVEATGRFDELNVALGFAKAAARFSETPALALADELETFQRDLIPLMGELSAADTDQERYLASRFGHLEPAALARLDAAVARLEQGDTPLNFEGWATPGKTPLAAALELARVAARRAERQVVTLRDTGSPVRDLLLQYVNRLSDLLWLMARWAEGRS